MTKRDVLLDWKWEFKINEFEFGCIQTYTIQLEQYMHVLGRLSEYLNRESHKIAGELMMRRRWDIRP
jgi:hypothetical protein